MRLDDELHQAVLQHVNKLREEGVLDEEAPIALDDADIEFIQVLDLPDWPW